jgi:CO/xanthine dehydrogenase Mo-binding subunit
VQISKREDLANDKIRNWQAVRRVEDQRFLTGRGRYVDDIALPGMCHGVNVLSPHAHARIKNVDTRKATAAPAVLLVLTGADVAFFARRAPGFCWGRGDGSTAAAAGGRGGAGFMIPALRSYEPF